MGQRRRGRSRNVAGAVTLALVTASFTLSGLAIVPAQALLTLPGCSSSGVDDKCEAWVETRAGVDVPTDIEVTPDGSRVFVSGKEEFSAFDSATGDLVWESVFPFKDDGSISALAVSRDGATVYVSGVDISQVADEGSVNTHKTVAVDSTTGAPRWKVKAGGDFVEVSPSGTQLYTVRSACPSDFHSYSTGCADYYEVKALNAQTGATRWKASHDTGTNGGDTPFSTSLSPDGDRLFVTGQGATVALSAVDGTTLWSSFEETDTYWAMATSSDGSRVITTGQTCQPDGSVPCNLYATKVHNSSTGAVEWLARLEGQTEGGPAGSLAWFGTWPEDGSLAVGRGPAGDRVYVTGYAGFNTDTNVPFARLDYDGLTIAYDLGTGAEVWQGRFSGTEAGTEENGWYVEASRDGSTVYVSGRAYSTGPSGGGGPRDFATLAYDAVSGARRWTARYNSAPNGADTDVPDGGMALARDGSRLFLAGTFNPTHGAVPTSTTSPSWGIVAYEGVPEPVAISVGDVAVHEGDSGEREASFTVSLSKPAATAVAVAYSTHAGTATSDDIAARAGTLSFAPGLTAGIVTVPITADRDDESDESFGIILSSPSQAVLDDGAGVGIILDDDPPSTTGRRLAIGDVSVHEGDAGGRIAVFKVSLSKASTSYVTVNYGTVKGTAVGTDFTAKSGKLSFAPGTTSLNVKIAITPDTLVEGDQTFTVVLSGASGALIADGTGGGTIIDND